MQGLVGSVLVERGFDIVRQPCEALNINLSYYSLIVKIMFHELGMYDIQSINYMIFNCYFCFCLQVCLFPHLYIYFSKYYMLLNLMNFITTYLIYLMSN